MRDYGKIYSSFWSSDKTKDFSDDAKLLAVYLLSCDHLTMTGCFRLPDSYVTEDLGWRPERVSKGFGELFRKGFCNRCEKTKWVWIYRYMKRNRPENPNQWIGCETINERIPEECAWKPVFMRFFEVYKVEKKGFDWKPFRNPLETLSKLVVVEVEVKEEVIVKEYSCAELQNRSSTPEDKCAKIDTCVSIGVIGIPLNDGSEYQITQKEYDEWVCLYPAIDVMQELRKVRAWNLASPKNRKTSRGVLKHVNGWLSRAQDSQKKATGGNHENFGSSGSKPIQSIAERARAMREADRRAEGFYVDVIEAEVGDS